MIISANKKAIKFAFLGLAIQLFGVVFRQSDVATIGTFLVITGLWFYAKAKGQNPAWGFLWLFGIIGLIILFFMKDRSDFTSLES